MKSSRSIIWIFDSLHHPGWMRETRILTVVYRDRDKKNCYRNTTLR
jgi:hypothetical protein